MRKPDDQGAYVKGGKGSPSIQLDGTRKEALDTGRNRLIVTGVLLTMAFSVIAARLVDLAAMKDGVDRPTLRIAAADRVSPGRGDIIDRNGVLLATTLPTVSLYANPRKILDVEQATEKLASVLPEISAESLRKKLSADRAFVWLKRNLTPKAHFTINALGLPGVYFKQSHRRVYPHGALFTHLLGRANLAGKGVSGVEGYFDETLRHQRSPLRLSLDSRVQTILRGELSAAIARFSAIGGAGVIMDVNNGEVIAATSLPDFDPNSKAQPSDQAQFNRVTQGVYEMGSTFKLFTTAMALDSKTVRLTDRYDARTPIKIARFTIRDYHAKNRWLSIPEILIHSSNIGSAKMAVDVGAKKQREYLGAFGLLKKPHFEVPEMGRPLTPFPWREINTMTISYGHGIAVSPLQLTAGVASLVNGGTYPQPTLKVTPSSEAQNPKRVIREGTSTTMRRLMRRVVLSGTGKNADVPGYPVGGKTGTADKPGGGRYSGRAIISSFVGVFPVDNPRYVVFVLVDEPKGLPETQGFATGGWVAAPVVSKVITQMAPLLGLSPDPTQIQAQIQKLGQKDINVTAVRRQHRPTRGNPVAAN